MDMAPGVEAYTLQTIIRKLRAPNPPHAGIIVGSVLKIFMSTRVRWVSDGGFIVSSVCYERQNFYSWDYYHFC